MTHPSRLLRRFEGRAKKRFGQHFLASEGIVQKICEGAGLDPLSQVLEIGPGLGVLTEELLKRAGRVVALELDPDMVSVLEERFGEHPCFELHHRDASKIEDWSSLLVGGGWAVVANLPYNVGTGIVTQLLREPVVFSRLVVMLQKEVAERMLAPPGSRQRGSLSVFVQTRARVSKVTRAPAGAFYPPPKVDSVVLRLDLFDEPATGGIPGEIHERVVRAAFSAPRKTVRNGLASRYGREAVDQAISELGLDHRMRPAVLSDENWIGLARLLECNP